MGFGESGKQLLRNLAQVARHQCSIDANRDYDSCPRLAAQKEGMGVWSIMKVYDLLPGSDDDIPVTPQLLCACAKVPILRELMMRN
jgi:hypothetical protein